MPLRSPRAGFTVLELMIVLVLVSLSLAAGIPAFSSLMQSNNLQNAGDQIAGHLRLARQTAVATGVPQVVAWSAEARAYVITEDLNRNGQPDAGEPARGPFVLPNHLSLASIEGFTGNLVSFSPRGSASQSGTVVLANARGNTRSLTLLAPTGQVRLH